MWLGVHPDHSKMVLILASCSSHGQNLSSDHHPIGIKDVLRFRIKFRLEMGVENGIIIGSTLAVRLEQGIRLALSVS